MNFKKKMMVYKLNSKSHFFLLPVAFLLFTFFLPRTLAHGQTPSIKFDHITVQDGLSINTVFSISQDHTGFMWFGTKNGLNKFDGDSFSHFRHDPNDINSISHNIVWAIFEDQHQNLWIGTEEGLNLLNKETETFTRFMHDPSDPTSISENAVVSIYEDQFKNLWVGTRNKGLNLLDRKTGEFKNLRINPSSLEGGDGNRVTAFGEDNKKNLYIGTHHGLSIFDRNNETFVSYHPEDALENENPNVPTSSRISSLLVDGNDRIWLGTQLGLYEFKAKTGTFEHFPFRDKNGLQISNRNITGISEDAKGNIWLSTNNGVGLFDKASGEFDFFTHDINDPYSLSDNATYCTYRDQKGDFWIGTYYGGVNVYHQNNNRFAHYFPMATKNSLSGSATSSILEDAKGNLWIGTEDAGLNYFDRISNRFSHFKANSESDNSISSNNIQSMVQDRKGNLWIATYGEGLNFYDIVSKEFTTYKRIPEEGSLSHDNVLTVFLDAKNQLWVGTDEGGLNLLDHKTKIFTRFRNDPENPESISNNNILSIFEDHSGIMWIGTSSGLNQYDSQKKKFRRFMFDPKVKHGLINPTVLSIFEDHKNTLWIGTNEGLCFFDRQTKTFSRFSEKEELSNATIFSIVEDDRHFLWMGTNKGLIKFNPATLKFKIYNAFDGLQGNQFNYHSSLKSRNGEIFFGGINGFNSFFPESIEDSNFNPRIAITDFLLFNKSVTYLSQNSPLKKPIGETKELVLNYGQNVFSFEFAALNFQSAENIKYAYKLKGFDTDWNFIGNKRNVSFTNLSPGNYSFQLKATNSDGLWNGETEEIKIKILPPFWSTGWAYLFYTIFILTIIFFLRKNTISKLNLKNDLKLERLTREKIEEVNQSKLNFFTNISHEFRTPLTLILGPLENLLANNNGNGELKRHLNLMKANANRLLKLINELMKLRNIQTGKMKINLEKTEINSFIEEMVLPFIDFAKNHHIEFEIISGKEPYYIWLDRDKMDSILFNLLSNAFKYTSEYGKITLRISQKNLDSKTLQSGKGLEIGYLEIIVEDSGIGIPEKEINEIFNGYYRIENQGALKQPGAGIGLALTKEFVELHHGSIYVESELQKGSKFIVHLPEVPPGFTENQTEQGHNKNANEYFDKTILQESRIINWDFNEMERPEPLVLLVEDDVEIRQFIKDVLKSHFRIIEANNGESGIALALEKAPEIIISDIMMPKILGTELCQQIKKDIRTSHIPVVLLTAKSLIEHQIEGVEMGADAYITKPFHPKFLLATIQNLLETRKNLQYVFSNGTIPQKLQKEITPDELFLRKAETFVENNIKNTNIDIETICREMGISSTLLYNKLKVLTGVSANEFIRHIRLKKSIQLLLNTKLTVSEIAYQVGFNDPRYFSRCFKKEFGMAPSEYLESRNKRSVLN